MLTDAQRAEEMLLASSDDENEAGVDAQAKVETDNADTEADQEAGRATGLPRDTDQLDAAKVYCPARALPEGMTYNVLLMAALPRSEKHIHVHKELTRIQQCLEEDKAERFSMQITPSIEAKTFQDTIFKSFRGSGDKLHLLHISCHGEQGEGEGVLVFDDGSKVNAANVIRQENCRCLHGVFLNACHSGLMNKKLLENGAAFVISCNQPVEDGAALPFAECFYKRLFAGQSLHDAFVAAEEQLKTCLDIQQGKEKGETVIELHCNVELLTKLAPETSEDQEKKVSAVTPDRETVALAGDQDEELAKEILLLLQNPKHVRLVEGQTHITAGNLDDACRCFEEVIKNRESLPAEDLAKAKTLLMYTLFKLGIKRLEDREYNKAAEKFGEALKQRLSTLTKEDKERLQKLQRMHACTLYEAAKQHRKEGNWGEARKIFEAASKTGMLPDLLRKKTLDYIQECKHKRKEKLWKQARERLEGETEKINLDEHNSNQKQAITLYRAAKRALTNSNFGLAQNLFQEACEHDGLPEALLERAVDYSDSINDFEAGTQNTANVFSDNFTHILDQQVTLDLSIRLQLGTDTLQVKSRLPPELVMILDRKFPADTEERGRLILLLKTDITNALGAIKESKDHVIKENTAQKAGRRARTMKKIERSVHIAIDDIRKSSVMVFFHFVCTNGSDVASFQEEYLRQVDDKSSKLYQGEITCCIDQNRTQAMTMQLASSVATAQTPCPYQVGDTITIAQVQEEKVECKVESLLGKGATATVFKIASGGGKVCALKVFKAKDSLEDLCTEASLMLTLSHPKSHPNVLRADFVWYEQRTNEMFFLLELIDGGNLQEWMHDERLYVGTTEQQQERLNTTAHQIACGVHYLHERSILHKDIKPENVLMSKEGRPVLADLGVASPGTVEEGTVKATLRGGTPAYASPHVRQLLFHVKALPVIERKAYLRKNPITHLDDFFSLGATILDMYAECGWRQGKSVAEMLDCSGSLAMMLQDGKRLRVAVPEGIVRVLHACFGSDAEPLTVDSIVDLMTKQSALPTPSTVDGMTAGRYVNIRNNLGIALYDKGVFLEQQGIVESTHCLEAANKQLNQATTADPDDARTLNNLGVIKWARGEADDAKRCFDGALEVEGDHAAANTNARLLQSKRGLATAQIDRSGAAGAVEDGRGKVDLATAVYFAPGQQLEVHRRSRWERTDAGGLGQEKPLISLTFRLPVPQAAPKYTSQQQLLVHADGEWRLTRAQEQSTPLNPTNHAPALFTEVIAMSRAQHAHTIELKDKHAFIFDLFSGQKLSVRTQIAMLQYREKERAAQILSRDDDTDAPRYQLERQKSLEHLDSATSKSEDHGAAVKATTILQEMLGGDDRAAVRLQCYLLIILGPAASGKTTLLKTFMMEMVHLHTDFVPILMPIIEVVPVLDACNHDEGESVVGAFIQHKYPQHAHLLLQMMLMRHAVFLVDGIDESGTHRQAVQEFVTVELLEAGHKAVITSRHSGFSSDAFEQCRLVELLPLSAEQQAELVRTRVRDDETATELVNELGAAAFKEIASNPLMLTMIVSVFVSNSFVVIPNRSELYEKALRTLLGRTDKHRAGLDQASQAELLKHLQKLASASHSRDGERRIFTAAQANEWAGPDGWSAIEGAMHQGQLPIIVRRGPNNNGEEEYRFGHMSYQEYLTGRDYYQRLTTASFGALTVAELFGDPPSDAFADVKQHLMLQLLADILSAEQRMVCLAAMCGGRLQLPVRHTSSSECVVPGCPASRCHADGYCENHRLEAAAALARAALDGGNTLAITATELGRAGMEALAPYVRDHLRLRNLVLPNTKLGADGLRVMVDALKQNTVLTALDVSENLLGADGAKVVAELLSDKGALTDLNISKNNIGALAYPDGWKSRDNDNQAPFVGPGGQQQSEDPRKPFGAIALADAISTNGALTSLNLADNYLAAEGAKHIAEALKVNGALTSLNISNNTLGELVLPEGWKMQTTFNMTLIEAPSELQNMVMTWYKHTDGREQKEEPRKEPAGAIAIANAIGTNGTLENLHIGANSTPLDKTKEIIAICESKPSMKVLCEVPFKDKTITELDVSGKMLGTEGALVISYYLKNNRALKILNISNNDLVSEVGTGTFNEVEALGWEMPGDPMEKVEIMKPDVTGAVSLADAIRNNGALTSLNISNNNLGQLVPPDGWTKDDKLVPPDGILWLEPGGYKHTDGRKQKEDPGSKPEGVLALADAIKNNRALVSANLLNNAIGAEQAQNLVAILKEHASLKSLCGNKGDETVLDMSGKNIGADGAVMLAPEIVANGALSKLIFGDAPNEDGYSDSEDDEEKETWTPAVLEVGMTEADLSNKNLGVGGAIIVGAWISHKNNGALTSLDISANAIASKEAGKALAEVLKTNTVLKELDVSDNLQKDWKGDVSGGDGPGFAKELAAGVSANEALTRLDISANNIGEMVLPEGWSKGYNYNLDTEYTHRDGRKQKELPEGSNPDGVLALADGIKNNGALVMLNVSDNNMFRRKDKAGITAWADALKANSSFTQLNLAKNRINGNDAKIIAPAISAMGAMTSLNLSANGFGSKGAKHIAAALPQCKALARLDISNNRIPNDQQANLKGICTSKSIDLML